ncbi:MAG: hypothetical protein P8X63_02655 [Desulfuromonadaceae bacterium]
MLIAYGQSEYKNAPVLFLVLSLILFSRVFSAAGIPNIINFLHFAAVPCALLFCFPKQVNPSVKQLLWGVGAFYLVVVFSALTNGAGGVNVLLGGLMLTEPFLLIALLTGHRWSSALLHNFTRFIFVFIGVHLFFILYQYVLQGKSGDTVQGVFLDMGAGAHVAGAVAFTAAVYFCFSAGWISKPAKLLLAAISLWAVIFTDSKQVFAVFLVATAILALMNIYKITRFFKLLLVLTVSWVLLLQLGKYVFPLRTYLERLGFFWGGLTQKFMVFDVFSAHFVSPFNWLFGLGPGHTVSRLGFLLPNYFHILSPLGATKSSITNLVWEVNQNHYLSNSETGSSIFSLMFSWAGIFGDYGFLGLIIYLYLWFLVWRHFCRTMTTKFLLLTVFIFGMVFSWMEEPGYILLVISLICLQWQKGFREEDSAEIEAGAK